MADKLKVQVHKKVPLSKEGKRRWNPSQRQNLYPWVFRTFKGWTVEVPVEEINSREKMGKWVFHNFGAGRFQVRAFSPNKHARGLGGKKMGVSAYTMVELVVTPDSNYPEFFGFVEEWDERRLNRWKRYLKWED